MSVIEIVSKIEELKELEALIREAEEEAEVLKDLIKAEMLKRNIDEMNVGRYVVHWTNTTTNRFDSVKFKSVMPDVYNMYIKTSHSKRFSISG